MLSCQKANLASIQSMLVWSVWSLSLPFSLILLQISRQILYITSLLSSQQSPRPVGCSASGLQLFTRQDSGSWVGKGFKYIAGKNGTRAFSTFYFYLVHLSSVSWNERYSLRADGLTDGCPDYEAESKGPNSFSLKILWHIWPLEAENSSETLEKLKNFKPTLHFF